MEEKDKKILEYVSKIKQESRVGKLGEKVDKIESLLKNKNDEIRENENYSLKLINIIKEQKNLIYTLKKEQKSLEENYSTNEETTNTINSLKAQIILVGNKSDLEEKRQVTKEMTNEFCENNNIKVFLETSAKKGTNVKNVFLEAAKLLLEHHQKQKNTVYTTESMKNVLIINDLNEKDISREINFTQSDEENSTNKLKKKCC